jgi:hypothetical protein
MTASRAVLFSRTPRFPLGAIVVTPRAFEFLGCVTLEGFLRRHASGDWGNVSCVRAKANALALEQDDFVLSQYHVPQSLVYVLTEGDRTRTAVFVVEA